MNIKYVHVSYKTWGSELRKQNEYGMEINTDKANVMRISSRLECLIMTTDKQ